MRPRVLWCLTTTFTLKKWQPVSYRKRTLSKYGEDYTLMPQLSIYEIRFCISRSRPKSYLSPIMFISDIKVTEIWHQRESPDVQRLALSVDLCYQTVASLLPSTDPHALSHLRLLTFLSSSWATQHYATILKSVLIWQLLKIPRLELHNTYVIMLLKTSLHSVQYSILLRQCKTNGLMVYLLYRFQTPTTFIIIWRGS